MITKTIPGHSQYIIDEYGTITRIEGARRPKVKASIQTINGKPTGYLYATLLTMDTYNQIKEHITDCPKPKRIAVHRLVCMAFNGMPPEGKPWVNHKDGNKSNNHYTNLEWTSISENIQHKFDSGLYVTPKGPNHWKYGTKATKATKTMMSAKKLGENHPKFKGWYVINGRKYSSIRQASETTGINPRKIKRMCMNKIDGCYFLDKNRLK